MDQITRINVKFFNLTLGTLNEKYMFCSCHFYNSTKNTI